MSWFGIEILVALSPVGLLLWWTVRSMRRHEQGAPDAPASPAEDDVP